MRGNVFVSSNLSRIRDFNKRNICHNMLYSALSHLDQTSSVSLHGVDQEQAANIWRFSDSVPRSELKGNMFE